MSKYPQLQDKEWLASEVAAKPLRQIAEEVNCPYSAVYTATKQHGIVIPHRTKHRYNPNKSEAVKAGLRKKFPDGRWGSTAANWRGGRSVLKNGYVLVHAPDHPRARYNRIFEHIVVAEQKLGRYLERGEIVHHINEDPGDNRPENLVVLTRSQHVKEHYGNGTKLRERVDRLESRLDRLEELLERACGALGIDTKDL